MNRGVILVATGHPMYQRYAINLANSLKSFEPVKITLLTDKEIDNPLFDTVIIMPQELTTSATKPKVHLYDFSPYDETIYLDVDMIWLLNKPISQLFNEMTGIEFTMINEGYHDAVSGEDCTNKQYPYWADLGAIVRIYKIERIYKTRSEFIYFKKGKSAKQVFDAAKKAYEKPKVETTTFTGGGVADEFAFNIATAQTKIYPHKPNWTPIYWEWEHRKQNLKRGQIIDRYYGYSLGGNRNLKDQEVFYNDLAKYFANKTGLKYPMLAKHKREHLKERIKI